MNHYTILMMGYNSRQWIENSVLSAANQYHDNFDVIAIDAQTTDGTYEYLLEQEKEYDNLTVVRNETRKYQTQNVYEGSQMAKEGSIIVTLDFDDWLPNHWVLEKLDEYYDENTWMTYGSKYHTSHGRVVGQGRYPDDIVKQNKFRQDEWRATHLRTFRRELILKIDPKDFIDTDGEWYKAAGDLTFMWPMLEMSGERFKYIPDGMYVYNEANEYSDWVKVPHEQLRIEAALRKQPPYQRLETL
jgi:glycosyltransferase involved in cell wall biosynthesis